jgi:hypothetical protein
MIGRPFRSDPDVSFIDMLRRIVEMPRISAGTPHPVGQVNDRLSSNRIVRHQRAGHDSVQCGKISRETGP